MENITTFFYLKTNTAGIQYGGPRIHRIAFCTLVQNLLDCKITIIFRKYKINKFLLFDFYIRMKYF